jgi:hypothetical protein
LVPLSEIAARLDRSAESVLRLRRLLGLPLLKLGPTWFGSWAAIERWARARPQNRGDN